MLERDNHINLDFSGERCSLVFADRQGGQGCDRGGQQVEGENRVHKSNYNNNNNNNNNVGWLRPFGSLLICTTKIVATIVLNQKSMINNNYCHITFFYYASAPGGRHNVGWLRPSWLGSFEGEEYQGMSFERRSCHWWKLLLNCSHLDLTRWDTLQEFLRQPPPTWRSHYSWRRLGGFLKVAIILSGSFPQICLCYILLNYSLTQAMLLWKQVNGQLGALFGCAGG